MEGDEAPPRARRESREGWVELFPFVFFAVTVIATLVAIALT
jgi:hypothetical protein